MSLRISMTLINDSEQHVGRTAKVHERLCGSRHSLRSALRSPMRTKPTFIKNGWMSAFVDSRFELGMMLLVGHVSESLYSSPAFDPRIAFLARSSGMRDAVTSIQIS